MQGVQEFLIVAICVRPRGFPLEEVDPYLVYPL
jgi:hypothetical protein